MVLPEGSVVPPLPYLLPVGLLLLVAGAFLAARRPPVTERIVAASVPWMVAGAAGHVLHQLDALPDWVAPLFGVPMVYLTLAAVAGVVWLLADLTADVGPHRSPAADLLFVGTLGAALTLAGIVEWVVLAGDPDPLWPAVALAATAVVTGATWFGLRRWFPEEAAAAGSTGILVVVGHTLDGVTTVIGLDVLDGAERSPLVDTLVGLWSRLPGSEVLGEAWPFVVLKVALAVLIIVLARDLLREVPSTARLALLLVAALGLAPGVHNLLLFFVGV
ncbi:MAG: DUF63 family protein [Halobacteriales archaeon]